MTTATDWRSRLRQALLKLRYPGLTFGRDVRILGTVSLARGARVHFGDGCTIRARTRFDGPGEVVFGPGCLVNHAWIGIWTRLDVGAGSFVAGHVLDNDFHNPEPALRHDEPGPGTRAPITVGENVWLCAASWVFKGVSIGAGSVVGAAAVVRSDVPAGVVVIGNPHQIVKRFG